MARQSFARKPAGEVDLDLCFGCNGIWFDQYESSQLTPDATTDLFALIDARAAKTARPISVAPRCPLCRKPLALTHDVQRVNRFTYHRCADCHGRFTTFFQLLREKEFVRSLSNTEIERLKRAVRQVRCASCGAPVDVERDAACTHCGAPLSFLHIE
jgi:transposase-like protein